MATEILRPNADGTYLELTPQNGGDHYIEVDEETPDGHATKVKVTVTAQDKTDTYGLPNHSEGSGTINSVKVYFVACTDTAGTSYVKASIYTHSTLYHGNIENPPATPNWTEYSHTWTTNPNTGSAWTWDEIDALEAGNTQQRPTGGVWPYVTQVYVEVDYTAVTEKTSSDTGSGSEASTQAATLAKSETGSGAEDTPMQSAILAGSETSSGIDALIFRLLAAVDTGGGVETGVEIEGLLKNLFASELGGGSDSLAAKIEMPTKGGGMKLWT